MKALHKSFRICLAALLLLALPLLGRQYACGLATLCGPGKALHQADKQAEGSALLSAHQQTLKATAPGTITLHKEAPASGGAQGHGTQSGGLPGMTWLLRVIADRTRTLLQSGLYTDFTLVQQLVLFPHHGFW